MTEPLALLNDIEALITGQKLNRARVEAGGHGSGVALGELRRVANEIRLKAEHFRALTSPSLTTNEEREKADAVHLGRWANRKGISG